MNNYIPVIICPMCSSVFKIKKQTVGHVLGKYFRGTDLNTNCKNCNYIFSIANNWKPIKEDQNA